MYILDFRYIVFFKPQQLNVVVVERCDLTISNFWRHPPLWIWPKYSLTTPRPPGTHDASAFQIQQNRATHTAELLITQHIVAGPFFAGGTTLAI